MSWYEKKDNLLVINRDMLGNKEGNNIANNLYQFALNFIFLFTFKSMNELTGHYMP